MLRKSFADTANTLGKCYTCQASCSPCNLMTRYEKRRTLLRAGHPGMMFYLLFSGSVFVNIEEKATKTGKVYTRTECVLPRGSMFGVRS